MIARHVLNILNASIAVCLCATISQCFAQLSMTVTESTIPGVKLLGQSDPDFQAWLQHSVSGQTSLKGLDPALSVVAIVVNQSPKPIVFYTVRYQILHPNGRMIEYRSSGDRRIHPVATQPPVSPGDSMLDLPVASFGWQRASAPNQTAYAGFLKAIDTLAGTTITASLDAVMFQDGQFAGPDQGGTFYRLTTEVSARQELLAQFQAMTGRPDSDVRSMLDSIFAEWSTPPTGPGPIDWRRSFRHLWASEMSSLLVKPSGRGQLDKFLADQTPFPSPTK